MKDEVLAVSEPAAEMFIDMIVNPGIEGLFKLTLTSILLESPLFRIEAELESSMKEALC